MPNLDDRPVPNDPGMMDSPIPPMNAWGVRVRAHLFAPYGIETTACENNTALRLTTLGDFRDAMYLIAAQTKSVIRMRVDGKELRLRLSGPGGDEIWVKIGGDLSDLILHSGMFRTVSDGEHTDVLIDVNANGFDQLPQMLAGEVDLEQQVA